MSRSFATHVLQSQSYDHTRTRTVPVSGLQSSGLFAQELPPSMSMMGNLEISLEVWERTQSQISDQDNITGLSLSLILRSMKGISMVISVIAGISCTHSGKQTVYMMPLILIHV
jgi:hypothetical protein